MKGNFGHRVDHEKIKELLEEGLRPSDVARIIGCSRERIRQLDLKYFGMTGRERSKARRIDNSRMLPVHPFVAVAMQRGYNVEPITENLRASTFRILVNGFRCGLFSSSKRIIGGNSYWTIKRSPWNLDFYVWSTSVGFIILPKNKQPADATTISLHEKSKVGAYSMRHDYIDYLNAWEQLEKKQKRVA